MSDRLAAALQLLAMAAFASVPAIAYCLSARRGRATPPRVLMMDDVTSALADERDQLLDDRDRLARLVDSGDWDGARKLAGEILKGEGEDA